MILVNINKLTKFELGKTKKFRHVFKDSNEFQSELENIRHDLAFESFHQKKPAFMNIKVIDWFGEILEFKLILDLNKFSMWEVKHL